MSANPTVLTLHSLLDRLEETVVEETTALTQRRSLDFDEINRRKSRSLLELTRVIRSLPEVLEDALLSRLASLRGTLVRNQELLGIHLAAAQEIATLLGDEMGQAASDGTYSFALLTGRSAP